MDFIRTNQLSIMLVLSSICFVILIFILMTNYLSKEKKRTLLFFVFSTGFLLFIDRYAYLYRGDTSDLGFFLARVCKYLVFASILNVVYGFGEFIKCIYKENHPNEELPKSFTIIKYIILMGHILLIVSQFTNLYYSFDADNKYHRERFYIICYLFPMIATILQYIVIFKDLKKIKKYISIPLILYFILPILSSILQLFVSGISLTNIIIGGVVIILYAVTIYDANVMLVETKRIESELSIAREIQLNECPNEFPAFPERNEFDLYAYLSPAKEVGGDFYDYFLLDDDHLGIVIADVSGKGVPAALNMVKSKQLLKGSSINIKDPGKVLTSVNEGFLDSNKLDMFVTMWYGVVEISTGKLTYANAAHEYPIIYNIKTGFLEDETKHGIPIGTMKGYQYRNNVVQLEKEDKLFLYTDGVIDSVNVEEKQFGLYRLLKTLNTHQDDDPEDLIKHLKKEVNKYSSECEQFDDITMVCFKLNDNNKNIIHKDGKFEADVKEIDKIYEYFSDAMASVLDDSQLKQYYVVIDEIFSNIAKYAYKDKKDNYVFIDMKIDLKKKKITFTFEDNGVPFNPTENMDPKTSKSAKDREVGGLGIYIVKNIMDKVTYTYKDNKNYLIIEKKY